VLKKKNKKKFMVTPASDTGLVLRLKSIEIYNESMGMENG